MNKIKILCTCLSLFVVLPSAKAEELVVQALIERANQLELAEKTAWLQLLHYRSHVFGGIYSQADDKDFFISENGKYDAAAELRAILGAFFLPFEEEKTHAQCRFPARLYWLNQQLGFKKNLPRVDCEKFKQWREKINANSISLIFPSMFLNNPASMFGHTFLRLDSHNKSPLLSYTLSYAAQTEKDDNALVYVYKGLSGGYPGRFTTQPYYQTVQSYGDIEHRDIWEYSLNLNQQEVDQLIRHVWELTHIDFDYYFIRENCSYRLLALLDVARQGINMTHNSHPVYAIPVDTVRTIKQAGLIKSQQYRPSITSRLEQMYAQMDKLTKTEAKNLITQTSSEYRRNLNTLDVNQQAKVLDFVAEVIEYRDDEEKNLNTVLSARSRIELESEAALFEFSETDPVTSHLSARWQLGVGDVEEEEFIEFGIRPGFHDLLDSNDGFINGASIRVLDTRLRWFEDKQQLKLEEVVFFGLDSLTPVTPWSTPVSARLEVSVKTRPFIDDARRRVFNVQGAVGYSAKWKFIHSYLLADFSIEHSSRLQDDYALYVGGQLGANLNFKHSRVMLSVISTQSQAGEEGSKDIFNLGYQIDFNQQMALRFDYEIQDYEYAEQDTWRVNWMNYF